MKTGSPRQTIKRRAKPAHPAPECLMRPSRKNSKGCTVLVNDVLEISAHRKRLADPCGYRPARCLRCGHTKLHIHDYRSRILRAHRDVHEIMIARYRCAKCRATFRVLPAFIARHLWRSLYTVADETLERNPSPARPPVPTRTIHRWNERLDSQLGPLHAVLQQADHPLAFEVHADSSRRTLVETYRAAHNQNAASSLLAITTLVHEIDPTQRVM